MYICITRKELFFSPSHFPMKCTENKLRLIKSFPHEFLMSFRRQWKQCSEIRIFFLWNA